MYYKKAAMFGLDARIALAIFGALSVISGAALYSAIQQSNAVKFLASSKEIIKAFEQFYLDTGRMPREHSNTHFKSSDLVVNPGFSGWKGPYLSYKPETSPTHVLTHYLSGQKGHIHFTILEDAQDWDATGCSGGSNPCYYWLTLNNLKPNNNLSSALDKMIDNSDGLDAGSFQTTHSEQIYHLKIGNINTFK